jgi:hypothetical protein
MAYFELFVQCERCSDEAVFVGEAKRGAVSAARSHGWHFAVGTMFMPICPKCQQLPAPAVEADNE